MFSRFTVTRNPSKKSTCSYDINKLKVSVNIFRICAKLFSMHNRINVLHCKVCFKFWQVLIDEALIVAIKAHILLHFLVISYFSMIIFKTVNNIYIVCSVSSKFTVT